MMIMMMTMMMIMKTMMMMTTKKVQVARVKKCYRGETKVATYGPGIRNTDPPSVAHLQ